MFERLKHHAYPKYAPRSQRFLFISLVICSIVNSATMGYDTMMLSGLIAVDSFIDYFKLTPSITGLLNASMWIGSVLSVLTMTFFCDRLGRKLTIFICAFICLIGIILQSAAQDNAMFIIARIIIGYGVETTGGAAPLLIAEIVPANFRGILVGIYFTMFNAGAIVASAITYGTGQMTTTWAWRVPAIIQAVPSVISILILPFCPESPRWLICQGETDYAIEVIEVAHNIPKKQAEKKADKIAETINMEAPFKQQFRILFSGAKPMLKRLFIILTFAWILEMGGSSVGSYYFTIVLRQAGIKTSKKLLEVNMISSCWNFVVSIGGAFFFDTIGRKNQAMLSLSGMIVCFFVLGGFIEKYGQGSSNKSAQYATLFWMFLFNGFYNFCYTPLNTLYPSELFPTDVRAAGMTFFHFWNAGFGLLASFMLPIAMDAVGWKYYMINAGYDLIFLPVIYFTWVETKGLTLEQISVLFGDLPGKPDIESGVSNGLAIEEKVSIPSKQNM